MRSRDVPGLRPGGVRSRLPEKVELRVCPRCTATRHWINDGLVRPFHISGNNSDVIDTVVSSYRKLLDKVARLPLDQAATDYATFKTDAPELAFNADGTAAKVPAFSDKARGKMFFNPIYREFNPAVKEPFSGLAAVSLQGVQLHEMCHFYLNMVDGSPAASNTAQCLNLAQSFQLFAMQLALGRPFP